MAAVRAGLLLTLLCIATVSARSYIGRLSVQHTVLHQGPAEDVEPDREVEGRRLDIVLVHYEMQRLQEMHDFWLDFISLEKVAALQPSVFIYCHSNDMSLPLELDPLFKHGGGIIPLDNVGREGSGYLQHILRYWHDLAEHTLFSQDSPALSLQPRFLNLFNASTGFLPLGLVGSVDCMDEFLPPGLTQQIYSMFTHRLCPPEGFMAGLNGEFAVSRHRIRQNSHATYSHLLELIDAPGGHWIHSTHNNEPYKDPANPFFGHVLERAWSLAFACYEPSHFEGCWQCDEEAKCVPDRCQCFDS